MAMIGPCFPALDQSALQNLGGADWNRGFRAKILLGGQWDIEPTLRDGFIAMGTVQLFLALVGIINWGKHGFIQTPATKRMSTVVRVTEHEIPFTFCVWQWWLGWLTVLLPSQWMSTTTFAIILLHVWAELPNFAMRITTLNHILRAQSAGGDAKYESDMHTTYRVLQVVAFVNFVLFLTTGNPYIQGLLGSFSFVADFGNFFVAPLLAGYMIRVRNAAEPNAAAKWHHTAEEFIMAAMQVLHVILFYGQAGFACGGSIGDKVYPTAVWMLSWTVLNQALFIALLAVRFSTPRPASDPDQWGVFPWLLWWFTNSAGDVTSAEGDGNTLKAALVEDHTASAATAVSVTVDASSAKASETAAAASVPASV